VGWFTAVKPRFRAGGLRLMPVRSDYPQSDPTLMLFTLLDRRLRPGQLPTDKRVVLLDTATAVAIGRYVLHGQVHRATPFAVHDHFTSQTHLLRVPVGSRLEDICQFIGIDRQNHRFRAGDFLRDLWIEPETAMGGGELIVHVTARHLDANPDPCIRCGWCVEACPTRINPAGLLELSQLDDIQGAKGLGLGACIECGICSYVCPTRLPLLSAIRGLRASDQISTSNR
jgi:electron transport complex protein RnfC